MSKLICTLGPRIFQQSRSYTFTYPKLMEATKTLSTPSAGIGRGSGGRAGGSRHSSGSEDIPYKVKGLGHIAIAVPDLSQAAQTYRSAFGAQVSEPRDLPEQGVTVVFVHLPNIHIELIHPLGDASPVAKFLQKNPKGGIHHVCLAVDDIKSASSYLNEEAGMRTLGSTTPTIGAEGKPILFLNPKDTMGVLIELQQASASSDTHHESSYA